ncbi:MAG: GlcG/HbpS family heme-binding protein [Xanthobacteraceae bacterium]
MSGITLAQASTIADVALKKGRELNLKPLVVSILDAGGHHVVYKREDKSPILRFQIATGKAYSALGMGMGSRGLFERSQKNPMFVQMLGQLSGGRVMGVPGGVLILDAAGDTIGAVGISGDTSDNDETCALAGIEAAGLKAETGLGKG